ncbi:hypothetical protein PSTT_02946 [Puccinia striiformis]|uniref:Uncharacterized protein n=1 Tax=Puccinia striiformis TaxID=27350 RepID=A0A2S4VYA4_9BASI|nr:hypothetical protein PSTT_02946 [Puccinia striiformis]
MAPFLPSSSLNKKPKQKPINFLIYQQHQLYHPIHPHRASSSSSNRDTSTSQSRPIPSSTQPSLPAVPEPSHSHEQEQTSCYKRLGTGQNDGIDSGSSGSDPEDPEVICCRREVDELEEDYDVEEADEIKEERDSQSAYVPSSPISACDWDEDWSTQSSSQQNNPSIKVSKNNNHQRYLVYTKRRRRGATDRNKPPGRASRTWGFRQHSSGYANQENDKLGSPIGAAPDVGEINKQFISKYSAEGVPLPGVAGRRQSSCEASMTPTEGVINLTATGPPTDQPAGVGGPIEPTAKILDYTINMPNIIGSDGECSKQDANLVAAVPHNHDITLNFVDELTAKENCNSLDVLPHSENIVSPNIAPHFIDIDITNIEEATRLLKQLDSGRFFFG